MKRLILKILLIDPPKITDLFSSIDSLIALIFDLLIIVSVLMTVYGGAMWMLSAGDPQKIKQAQGTITWAIFGLIFSLLIRVVLFNIFNWVVSA